jgi:hypothetical protein
MTTKKKEYHIDAHAEKAAKFFLAYEHNPDTTQKIPAAMRAKGYNEEEAADQIIIQQVHCKVDKIKRVWSIPGPLKAAATAVTALLSLGTVSNTTRTALAIITHDLAATSTVATMVVVGGVLASIRIGGPFRLWKQRRR